MALGSLTLAAAWQAPKITPDVYSGLSYRYIGPPGNRTSAVAGVPGDPMVYYIGASSGGVFKSTDAGLNWEPIFDAMPAQSVGALAIAPSDHNVVWVGTGEAFVRSNISIGNGVYKSTDAGRTWKHMGLDATGRIGRVVIDPRDPNIVHVAAVGHGYGPQRERGVFRTMDGGMTWEQTLFIDEDTGVFEIAMDPTNPRILFAGAWPIVIRTYGRESGGPNGGIYRSRDGGSSWEKLEGHGLPEAPIGKVGIAIAQSNPDVVYALMETGYPNRGVLWRSSDGGDNWVLMSYDRILNERPHYASRILVSPSNENEVYFAANSHSVTYDGGLTTETTGWSGDTHDLWADPLMPDRMMISDDEGNNVNTLRGTGRAGINRVPWNLRYPGGEEAKLRTKPPGNPHVVEEKRFRTTWEREGWYPVLSWGTSGGFQGFMVAPGTYTIKLTVGGREMTRDLIVLKDPRSDGTQADIEAQVELQLEIRDDLTKTSRMLSGIELMKKQLATPSRSAIPTGSTARSPCSRATSTRPSTSLPTSNSERCTITFTRRWSRTTPSCWMSSTATWRPSIGRRQRGIRRGSSFRR